MRSPPGPVYALWPVKDIANEIKTRDPSGRRRRPPSPPPSPPSIVIGLYSELCYYYYVCGESELMAQDLHTQARLRACVNDSIIIIIVVVMMEININRSWSNEKEK